MDFLELILDIEENTAISFAIDLLEDIRGTPADLVDVRGWSEGGEVVRAEFMVHHLELHGQDYSHPEGGFVK